MNDICVWKEELSEYNYDEGYKTSCGIWLNKELINPYFFLFCPRCGKELDMYMSEEEIQEKMKNDKLWFYVDEKHLQQCFDKIKKNGLIKQPHGDYEIHVRFASIRNAYFLATKIKNFIKENYNLENEPLIPSSGPGYGFHTERLLFRKRRQNENI